jgi:sugar phosphate isomerase/epimerase
MRIGICTEIKNAGMAGKAGYEYLEASCSKLMSMTDGEYAEGVQMVRDAGLAVEHLNDMIPAAFRLTGPDADLPPVREYLGRLMERIDRLEVKSICFGSGAARRVPNQFPQEAALEQLAGFLRFAGDIVAPKGIVITIEALRPAETNIIHSISEALSLALRTRHPQVRVLADWYHMAEQKESTLGMLQTGSWLRHCHIARPAGRAYPGHADGAEEYAPFFRALQALGYSLDLSVESSVQPEEEFLSSAYQRIKSDWERTQEP